MFVYRELFDALDRCESMLGSSRYLVGNQLTEADVRLFMTLIRFDHVSDSSGGAVWTGGPRGSMVEGGRKGGMEEGGGAAAAVLPRGVNRSADEPSLFGLTKPAGDMPWQHTSKAATCLRNKKYAAVRGFTIVSQGQCC